jgi:cold shock protein
MELLVLWTFCCGCGALVNRWRRNGLMASGKVKWWNKSGFGFITQETGQDVFVHHSAVVGAGFKDLKEGEEVIFDIIPTEKGPKAENVRRAEAR